MRCKICLSPTRRHDFVYACACPSPYHQDCIRHHVVFNQMKSVDPVRCLNCGVIYRAVPELPVVSAMHYINHYWYPRFADTFAQGWLYLAQDVCYASQGYLVLSCLFGARETKNFLFSLNPFFAWCICSHGVLFCLILINYLPLEDALLVLMRRSSRLPILKRFMPREDSNSTLGKVVFRKVSYFTLGGAVLMTVYAKKLGDLLFKSSNRSFLYGALTYLAVKGVFKMFYSHKRYIRDGQLDIMDFHET